MKRNEFVNALTSNSGWKIDAATAELIAKLIENDNTISPTVSGGTRKTWLP
jgi:hypothetical protein